MSGNLHTSRSRDAALRRLRSANRWLIAGSATLTGVLTAVAAGAFPGKTLKDIRATASGDAHRSTRAAGKRAAGPGSSSSTLKAPAQAPQSSPSEEQSPAAGEGSSTQEATPSTSAPETSGSEAGASSSAPEAGSSVPEASSSGSEAGSSSNESSPSGNASESSAPQESSSAPVETEAPVVSGGS